MRDQILIDKLNFKGKTLDPNRPTIAIMGAKICSEYGRYIARHLTSEIADARPDMQFVLTMSNGVSHIAAKAALRKGCDVFLVSAGDVDRVYPPEIQEIYDDAIKQGGILSQFPEGTGPKSENYYKNYEMIPDIVERILFIDARRKSGILIDANFARELGTRMYAVPGRITDRLSDGVNQLIKSGAKIVTCIEDLDLDKEF